MEHGLHVSHLHDIIPAVRPGMQKQGKLTQIGNSKISHEGEMLPLCSRQGDFSDVSRLRVSTGRRLEMVRWNPGDEQWVGAVANSDRRLALYNLSSCRVSISLTSHSAPSSIPAPVCSAVSSLVCRLLCPGVEFLSPRGVFSRRSHLRAILVSRASRRKCCM